MPNDFGRAAVTFPHMHCSKIETLIQHLHNVKLSTCQQIPQAMESEYKCLDEMKKAAMSTEEPGGDENVSRAAYLASNQPTTDKEHTQSNTALLQIFNDQAKSVNMNVTPWI